MSARAGFLAAILSVLFSIMPLTQKIVPILASIITIGIYGYGLRSVFTYNTATSIRRELEYLLLLVKEESELRDLLALANNR